MAMELYITGMTRLEADKAHVIEGPQLSFRNEGNVWITEARYLVKDSTQSQTELETGLTITVTTRSPNENPDQPPSFPQKVVRGAIEGFIATILNAV